MPNFSTHAYLNSYLSRFRDKLPSNNLTVQDLHAALYKINIKPTYGTMYSRQDLEKVLNFLPLLDNLRNVLNIPTSEKKKQQFNKSTNITTQQEKPNKPVYFSSEEMQDASNELLRNDGVFNENKTFKLTESDIKQIVYECVKKIKESEV